MKKLRNKNKLPKLYFIHGSMFGSYQTEILKVVEQLPDDKVKIKFLDRFIDEEVIITIHSKDLFRQ